MLQLPVQLSMNQPRLDADRVGTDLDDPPHVTGKIDDQPVPERLSGDWWRDGYGLDYWRCESDEECGELILYRDAGGWWVQGWYD